MIQEKSCGAIVFLRTKPAKYLLLHYEAGHWDFVKGNVEPNESEKDTVIRELREETGITDAQFIEGFRERIEYFYRRQGEKVHKKVVFFLVETHTEKVELSYEHVGYIWLDYHSALDKLTFRNAKVLLTKAHELLKAQGLIPL
ncbi:MAG: NUDIX domain-containing protein [Candidatus Bathyarchaeota archaeon]|nr:NUDIX domain-containing protein [Candidatus Bathyarchaeota archaeon]